MTSGDSLRETAQLVDVLRDVGIDVEDVTVTADAEGELVELAVRLPEETAELADERVGQETEIPLTDRGEGGETAPGTGTPGDDDADAEPRSRNPDSSPEAATAAGSGSGSTTAESDDDGSGGEVSCRVADCDRTFSSKHGMKIHAAKSHDVEEASEEQPHRDPEQLQAVYEANDTFDEMRDALGADVTAQTVRRNMMKFGIHEPEEAALQGNLGLGTGSSDDTESVSPAEDDSESVSSPEEDAETESPVADGAGSAPEVDTGPAGGSGGGESGDEDGRESEAEPADDAGEKEDDDPSVESVGDVQPSPAEAPTQTTASLEGSLDLPDDIDVEEFVDAVKSARTLFEFQRALGLDRPTAQELLATLDLYDLVTGRVGTSPVEETPEEEIVSRIADALDTPVGGNDGLSAD